MGYLFTTFFRNSKFERVAPKSNGILSSAFLIKTETTCSCKNPPKPALSVSLQLSSQHSSVDFCLQKTSSPRKLITFQDIRHQFKCFCSNGCFRKMAKITDHSQKAPCERPRTLPIFLTFCFCFLCFFLFLHFFRFWLSGLFRRRWGTRARRSGGYGGVPQKDLDLQ